MNTLRDRTNQVLNRLGNIWNDCRYASRRLSEVNRPWLAERRSARS